MRLALLLSGVALVASLLFYASTSAEEVTSSAASYDPPPEPPATLSELAPTEPSPPQPSALPTAEATAAPDEEEEDGDDAIIRGRVVGEALPEDVQVIAVPVFSDDRDDGDEGELDSNGAFALDVAPGRYRIVARAPGFLPAASEPIAVDPREERDGVTLALVRGSSISGSVSSVDGEPPGAASVILAGEGFRLTQLCAEDGTFEFDGLPVGTFELFARTEEDGTVATQARSGDHDVHLTPATHVVRGRVLGVDGAPVAHPTIQVSVRGLASSPDRDPYGALNTVSADEDFDWMSASTDADDQGNFELRLPGMVPATLCTSVGDAFAATRLEPGVDPVLHLEPVSFKTLRLRTDTDAMAGLEGVDCDAADVTALFRHGSATLRIPSQQSFNLRIGPGIEVDESTLPSNVRVLPEDADPGEATREVVVDL